MNKYLILIIILFAFYSCKKDKTEYINYNSEILRGPDTLIYGNWDYLYTWTTGGWGSSDTKENQDLPSILFTPIGNYKKIKDGQSVEEGKITIQYGINSLVMGFYENGINVPRPIPPKVDLSRTDTLILTSRWGGNDMAEIAQYYVKVKD
jgi:hypothetical protein